MKDINSIHYEAMSLAELAFVNKAQGNAEKSQEYFTQAFQKEWEAARELLLQYDNEPSRSILLRSAASLALNCKDYKMAEQIIGHALAGTPPSEIAEELRDLYEQINFDRHLELRGLELDIDEFQFSMSGAGVGHGMIISEEFISRINLIEKMTLYTAERKLGRPYREKGRPSNDIRLEFEPYISVPRAASFSVTIRLGRPLEGQLFPDRSKREEVIDELFSGISLLNENKVQELKELIPDERYYNAFVDAAKRLAPDGKNIRMVGFTTKRGDDINILKYTKVRDEIVGLVYEQPLSLEPSEEVTVTGILSYADASKRKIKIDFEHGKYDVEVPKGIMHDFVKQYWEEEVTIRGNKVGDTIYLIEVIEGTE